MSDDVDRVLDMIDGALQDSSVSPDAMRWSPEPPEPAADPVSGAWVTEDLPAIRVRRGGIRYPASGAGEESQPNIMDAIRQAADEYRERYQLNPNPQPPIPQIVTHHTEQSEHWMTLRAVAETPAGTVYGYQLVLSPADLRYPEMGDRAWRELDRKLIERLRVNGEAEHGVLIIPEGVELPEGLHFALDSTPLLDSRRPR